MQLLSFLLLAVAPLPLLALELNAFEMLMFYDMYRADYEQNGSKHLIAKACDDCDFEQFVMHLDRFNTITEFRASFEDMANPYADEIMDWNTAGEFVYDAKKLLGGLWRDEDVKTRPGHPAVIERLVDRTNQIRASAEPERLDKIIKAMEVAQLARRKAQAKDLVDYVGARLNSARLGAAKTQQIPFFEGGQFQELDSLATIESVQRTKKAAMRKEIIAIARDINGGTAKRALTGRNSEDSLVKRALSGGMAVMSLQRGLDSFRQPVRRKC